MIATRRTSRTVRVEHCMGTVFTIDIRDAGVWDAAVAEVVAGLHEVDRVFSTYRSDSDISLLRRGELTLVNADPTVAEVFDLCATIQARTGGFFTPRWRGGLDPTGLVKGWAVERASQTLREHGSANHAVNGGGDMQLAGESAPGQPWRVGIADPADPARVLTVVSGRDCAIATSGTAERGEHIVDPFTGRPAAALRGVTVTGPALTFVDAYATAAFAMGEAAIHWLDSQPGYEALVVRTDGSTGQTVGWDGT